MPGSLKVIVTGCLPSAGIGVGVHAGAHGEFAPARVVRTLDPAQVERMGAAARSYIAKGPRYKTGLKKIG